MNELDDQSQTLLDWLVGKLPLVTPGRTTTYVGYKDAHDELRLPLMGDTYGVSLQHQGLNSLADWTKAQGVPGITGLIIDRSEDRPGKGYFDLFDRTIRDREWWTEQIRLSKEFDWKPYVSPSVVLEPLPVSLNRLPEAPATPVASDIDEPPERIQVTTYRVLRDTALAGLVKKLHEYNCQLCGKFIALADGGKYAESHHIRPLGGGHAGPDVIENILCVCPNHHVLLDYGAMELRIGVKCAPEVRPRG